MSVSPERKYFCLCFSESTPKKLEQQENCTKIETIFQVLQKPFKESFKNMVAINEFYNFFFPTQ